MRALRYFLFRAGHFFRRNQREQAMAEEIEAHIAALTDRHVAAGMSVTQARRAALREFGGVEQIKERGRDARSWLWLEQLLQDLRFAVRSLRKHTAFTLVVTLTLALGIGLTTVGFSVYRAIVAKPLAVRAPTEIVRLSWNGRQEPFTYDEFQEVRRRLGSADGVVAISPLQPILTTKADAAQGEELAAVQFVSPDFFSVLGVPAALGRTFIDRETSVAVLSHTAWERRFGSDVTVLGRVVKLNGMAVTVIGVAPETFGGTGAPPAVPDYWLPMAFQPQLNPTADWINDPRQREWRLLARRRPGTALEQMRAELAVIATAWRQSDGRSLHPAVTRALFFGLDGPEVHAIGVTLIAAVGLILVIGCINVLNLIAARNTVREPELAIRLALGAGKGRLMRQLCTETLLLGLLGGGAGFLGSLWVCDALHVWALALMHDVTGGAWNLFVDLSPDPQVFTFAVVLSVAAGLGVGLRPALRAAGTNIESALKRRAAGLTVGGRPHRNLLLGVQVAGSLVLLAGAALLLRGAVRAGDVDPGFDSKHLALVVAWSQTDIGQVLPNRRDRAQRIEERLRALPEVASIGAADRVPLLGHSITPFRTDEDRWVNGCVMTHVDADYFPTLGLRVLAGRTFTPEEVSTRAPVAVITQSAARHLWPNGDALQRHFAIGKSDDMYTVIGVIADARLTLLSRVDDVDAFFPQAGTAAWLVRTRGKPAAAFPSLYATMRAIDPAMPVEVQAMEEGPMRLQRMMARIPATIALFLAGLSLALAAVGISGAVAFAVAQRTREIGVRMALGATSASVIRHILRQTLRSAVWGAVFGTLGAIATAVLLTRLVLNPEFPDVTYGASTFPWFSLAAALGVLLVVLLAAAILPARRASKVDPLVALRGD